MSLPESTAQHVARRLELITNWLALAALLGIGVVWGPGAENGATTPAASGASLHARTQAPQALHSRSDPPHQARSPPARVPCRRLTPG